METLADLAVDQILCFLLALVRIATMIAVFPVIGSRGTPKMVKAGLAFMLTMIIFPLLNPRVLIIPTSLLPFALVVAKEMLVGITMGFAGLFIFQVVQYGSKIIDQEMSFAMAETVDPLTDAATTPVAQLFTAVFTIMFLIFGGHHIFIEALVYSFKIIKVGEVHFQAGPVSSYLSDMTAQIFDLGLRFSGPVLVSLIITTATLGILARTAPQMNVFVIGMPLQIGIGIIVLIIAMPSMFRFFEQLMVLMRNDIFSLMKLMA